MYVFRTQNDAARAFKRLRDHALDGTAEQAEITLPRVGREPLKLTLGAAPGAPGEVIWSSHSVSAVRDQDALTAELAGLRNQLETVPVGMAVLDADGVEFEVEIDADTGDVLEVEAEDDDHDDDEDCDKDRDA